VDFRIEDAGVSSLYCYFNFLLLCLLQLHMFGELLLMSLCLLLLSYITQCDMVFKLLMFFLARDDFRQQFPVLRRVFLLYHKVVTLVPEVWHHLHPADSIFNVFQFFETQRV